MSQPPYPPYSGSPTPDPDPHPRQPGYGEQYPPPNPQYGGGYPPPNPQYGAQYPPAPGPYPPGYGQPADQAQPGYTPQGPAYGGGYGTPPAEPSPGYPTAPVPPKKSKVGRIILIVLAVVLVLCGGGVAVAYFALKDEVSGVVAATQTRLVTPDTVAGRPRITEPELQTVADAMVASMKEAQPGANSTVGAFYGDPAKRDLLMVAGVAALVADPAKELDAAMGGLGTSGVEVTNLKSIEPGPLGGVAKCGDAEAEGIPLGVCVWADHGSLGVIGLYFKTGAEAEAEFQKIRGEVEQRD